MPRLIPCLDVRAGRVVKGVRFSGLRDAGDPAILAARYEADGADELVLLDVSATAEDRAASIPTIQRVRAAIGIPMTVGGGIRTAGDAAAMLAAGADKVSINTAAVQDPGLIRVLAAQFGSQCVVVAVDAAATGMGTWEVLVRSGSTRTGLDAVGWAARAAGMGAGEVLLTSWDRDGTQSGYDLELIRAVSRAVPVPVVASGGASSPDDLAAGLSAGANAVLAASIFHDGRFTVAQAKAALLERGVEVRA